MAMPQNKLYESLSDDITLFNSVLIPLFESFFDFNNNRAFKARIYFNFTGVGTEKINLLYSNSQIKGHLPIELNPIELFVLLAVVAPYYYPDSYSWARYLNKMDTESFSIVGGKITGDNKCFFPTGETILFLLAGHNIEKRFVYEEIINFENKLFSQNLLSFGSAEPGTPRLSGQLYPTDELLALLKGVTFRPEYSTNFPASRIKTKMEWEDLILPYETHEDLEELKIWMEYGKDLLINFELGKRLKPGYRCLFYGPPGTGKTLTASLLGKNFNVDVYRIDLSMVVSKWVGETEKNLKNIFDQATNKNWILFFDEADSLFGKRTSTNSSNDRYANQEVSYLLQRIEDFPGLVILASNLKSNIDEAFNRRFQSVIYFPMPNPETRYILWSKAFPKEFPLESKIDISKISKKYELAGGAIINIVRYCALKAMDRKNHEIQLDDLEHGIVREFKKEGKIVG
jgi:adenylate kinase family enzyme